MADSTTSIDPKSQYHLLSARYESPTNASFSHTQKLPALPTPTPTTTERVTYLATLRKATAEMQDHINKELTQRMEDDKSQEAGGLLKGQNGIVVDEGKEEENYGEEVQEED